MIEVEKKFQPTDEQLASLLRDAKFVSEEINRDVMYDYSDYRLFDKDIRLRNRNGKFELKIPRGRHGDEEVNDEEKIKAYFNTNEALEKFVAENLTKFMEIITHRKKYKKDEFSIDIDNLDFGYRVCEIELLVDNEDQIEEAHNKIIGLAKKYNFEVKNLPKKREAFLRMFRPDLYKRFYPSN